MSVPLPLLVPAPSLAFKPVGGTYAPLEGAVRLSFSAVRFPDGSAMTADDFADAQALLCRSVASGVPGEVWNPETKSWQAISSTDLNQLKGLPLLPPQASSTSWEGVLLAAGQMDASGAPQIQLAAPQFPQYRLRGFFHARRGGADSYGLGPESVPIQFASAAAAARFTAELTPNAESATRARIVLRNAAAQAIGVIDIDASSGAPVVTLANLGTSGAGLAAITLEADGSIRLTPSPGRKVIIAGDLEAETIRYLPITGLPKKDLG